MSLKMKKFFKNYWLIIFLALIASLLIGIFFIKKDEGPWVNPNLEKLLPLPYPKFKEYQLKIPLNFNDLLKNFPELAQGEFVYEIENPFFTEQEAIEIAKNFGFKNDPELKNYDNKIYYEWNDPQKDFIINLTEGKINFTNKNPNLDTSLISLPDISKIDSAIKSILAEKELLPNEEINLLINDKSYLKLFGYEYGTTNDPKEAFAIQVKLQYKLKKIRFLENDVIILVGDKNEILKLDYQSIFKKIKILDSYPLKNKEEIIEKLKTLNSINYFKIINDYELLGEPQNIKSVDLDKIELVYLKTDTPQSYLQPLFFISGQAVLNDGRVAEVGVYLPAIKDQYLLK